MGSATSPLSLRIHVLGAYALALGMFAVGAHAQKIPARPAPPEAAERETPADNLGRSTPRGTVRGFLDAARAGEDSIAAQYLDQRGARAAGLARELFAVLDARLPARVMLQISDAPEGSGANPLTPNEERVGTINGRESSVEIVLTRVQRAGGAPIWLFSRGTLEAVPALYEEVVSSRGQALVPDFLENKRIGGIRLFDLVAILFGLPALYLATIVLDRVLTPLLRAGWRRVAGDSRAMTRTRLPAPARVLLVMVAGGWLMSVLPLSLAARQLWSNAASIVVIGAVAWLVILLNGEIERYVQRRLRPSNLSAATSLLRVLRRCGDALVLFAAILVLLRLRGIDPTPALAGLGVGGIAIALAAQKTLENVIAGASLIFDQAVRVGDVLKMGDILGTVDHIGLRSTRIRTFDRTVVSVPNGQIAAASLETLSSRDKFWFHPIVGLRYETTAEQLRAVTDGIRRLLADHPAVDPDATRVRFFRLGSFSLDVEVFTYVRARDWNHFLEIQEQLLFQITEIVSAAGTSIAFPSQTMYVANRPAALPTGTPLPTR